MRKCSQRIARQNVHAQFEHEHVRRNAFASGRATESKAVRKASS